MVTSNEMVSVPVLMFDTLVVPTGRFPGTVPESMRCQLLGPVAASSTLHWAGSRYQLTVSSSQVLPPLSAPLTTAGSFVSGATSAESATS